MHKGSCLCGAVTFTVASTLAPPEACHCTQCRKQSGHHWASTDAKRSALTIHGQDRLTWFASSPTVRRGFCATCGAFLFWAPAEKDHIAIAMGAFDASTETRLSMHIFVADKGDYYEIADGLPQHAASPPEPAE
jgi:hypothetical protein